MAKDLGTRISDNAFVVTSGVKARSVVTSEIVRASLQFPNNDGI